MSKKSRIIAFAGRKRAGKDMLAIGIKEYMPNSEIITIADNLKFLCCELLNVSYEKLNKMKDDGTTFKEKVDGRWVTILHARTGIADDIICKEIGNHVFTTVREMLQVIGTDLIRKYVPDWHIDKTIERIKAVSEFKIVIVDDVRFPNERCKIEALGGEVFFVIRPNCFEVSNHSSETALSYGDFNTDKVIINDLPKEIMRQQFNSYYFEDKDTEILLSSNLWYIQHVMDVTTDETQINADRKLIIKETIGQNREKLPFVYNGIINFFSTDAKMNSKFKRIIMNDRRGSDGCTAYSVYNPLTNEILKRYM